MRVLSVCAALSGLLLAGLPQTQGACTGFQTGTATASALTVFITSTAYDGDMVKNGKDAATALGIDPNTVTTGMQGADLVCQNEAVNNGANAAIASLATNIGFAAFLVGQTGSIVDGFDTTRDVKLVDGSCMASSLTSLVNPGPSTAPNGGLLQPNGQAGISGAFRTGVDSSTGLQSAIGSCTSYTTRGGESQSGSTASTGLSFMTDAQWDCDANAPILCVSLQQAAVQGDPQIQGLQGQSFQVHGIPDEWFNLVSTPSLQFNSKFTYLNSGSCTYNNTACWTHPGTYNSELGFMVNGARVHIIAGTHKQGPQVQINGILLSQSSHIHHHDNITVKYQKYDEITVITPLFTFYVVNSDMFFNFGIEMHAPDMLLAGRKIHHIKNKHSNPYPQFPVHGLVGGTWRNARYGPDNKLYEGHVEDYMVMDGIWGTDFYYNQYQGQAEPHQHQQGHMHKKHIHTE